MIRVNSRGHVLRAFVNGEFIGEIIFNLLLDKKDIKNVENSDNNSIVLI